MMKKLYTLGIVFVLTACPMRPLVEFDGDDLGFYDDGANETPLPPAPLEQISLEGG